MKTSGNTILITNAQRGTGLELAKLLATLGNKVIITGNNKAELQHISQSSKNIHSILCDLTSDQGVSSLISKIHQKFPLLNIFINNSGQTCFDSGDYYTAYSFENLCRQYLAGIHLTEELLPLFEKQHKALIIDASLLTIGVLQNTYLFSGVLEITSSYNKLLRHKIQNSKIEVRNLQPRYFSDLNSNPVMTALRIIETIYNKNTNTEYISGLKYELIDSENLTSNFLNN